VITDKLACRTLSYLKSNWNNLNPKKPKKSFVVKIYLNWENIRLISMMKIILFYFINIKSVNTGIKNCKIVLHSIIHINNFCSDCLLFFKYEKLI
jgi:hypothetical protein